jgi:hypothetical protein
MGQSRDLRFRFSRRLCRPRRKLNRRLAFPFHSSREPAFIFGQLPRELSAGSLL